MVVMDNYVAPQRKFEADCRPLTRGQRDFRPPALAPSARLVSRCRSARALVRSRCASRRARDERASLLFARRHTPHTLARAREELRRRRRLRASNGSAACRASARVGTRRGRGGPKSRLPFRHVTKGNCVTLIFGTKGVGPAGTGLAKETLGRRCPSKFGGGHIVVHIDNNFDLKEKWDETDRKMG